MVSKTNWILVFLLLSLAVVLSNCNEAEPPEPENEEEIINKVTLTFSPAGGGGALIFTAFDPDGAGPDPIEIDDIELSAETTYDLVLKLENTLTGDDITAEIRDEAEAHMFFFGWTSDLFQDPTGDGNIDNRNDPVNYEDEDENGLPIGLETSWQTGIAANGTFQLLLKHQPGLKSASSTSQDGATDADLTFNIEFIQ
jgi:hypothetical protein